MTARIDSIYYYDYTKDIGRYDSIRNFSSEKMLYTVLALSTPKIHVDSSPNSFTISPEGSNRIREFAISQMNNLQEVSKDLAINSPKYICICYFDGTERYFAYNESFCDLFKLAYQYKPHEKKEELYESPIALQTSNSHSILSEIDIQELSKPSSPTPKKKMSTKFKIIIGIIFAFLIFAPMLSAIDDNNSEGVPLAEPRSGTILSGTETYGESEITVTASGGESCVVKLKTYSGVERLSFYVRAGETVTVGVPAEFLYVYFASGDDWYGRNDLFGKKTSYSMDDELCDFAEYTCEYTLYPVTNGNFSQTPIDADEFN